MEEYDLDGELQADLPVVKKAQSLTFLKIQELQEGEIGEGKPIVQIDTTKDNDFPKNITEPDLSSHEDTTENIFGWITNKDQKY